MFAAREQWQHPLVQRKAHEVHLESNAHWATERDGASSVALSQGGGRHAVTELLLVLVPVSFVVGWLLASRQRARLPESGCAEVNPAYFRGLNFLLNEQPDKAIDVFIELLEVDCDTVETHLALGNLFRRRGEVDRAIRVHQNLIARTNLTADQRGEALLELGQDYMRAGLFDRAENLFSELIEQRLHPREALDNLLLVYQHERDWRRCLEVAEQLEPVARRSMASEKVHYHCELAEEALSEERIDQARALLDQARRIDKRHPRPLVMQVRLAVGDGDCASADRLTREVERIAPRHVALLIDALTSCYDDQGRGDELTQRFVDLLEREPSVPLIHETVERIARRDGPARAADFLQGYVGELDDPALLHELIRMGLASPETDPRQLLTRIEELLGRMLADQLQYTCSHCGFQSRRFHWQCPGCKHWETLSWTTFAGHPPKEIE